MLRRILGREHALARRLAVCALAVAAFAASAHAAQSYLMTFSASVDGSDQVTLSGNTGTWQHKSFQYPSGVMIDGQSWNPKTNPNHTFLSPLLPPSLSGYAVRVRRFAGRDTYTADIVGNKLVLGLSDTPNGADIYKYNVALIPEVKATVSTNAFKLNVTADIDGSDELTINRSGATWAHRFWSQPSGVSIGGVNWNVASQHTLANSGATHFLPAGVSFQNVTLAQNSGRDIVGIDDFSDHVNIYFADAPVGGDLYNVTLNFRSTGMAAPLAGDANSDGKVDLTDLAIINRNIGKKNATWSMGDFNFDGVVNASDRSLWANNYAGPLPPGVQFAQADPVAVPDSLSVPEPSAGVGLILIASLGAIYRPRRTGS